MLADKEYWRVEDIVSCDSDDKINAIVAVPKDRGTPGYRKSDFKYSLTGAIRT